MAQFSIKLVGMQANVVHLWLILNSSYARLDGKHLQVTSVILARLDASKSLVRRRPTNLWDAILMMNTDAGNENRK